MKKRKNRKIGKKLMSSILALTMAMGFTPGIALASSESVDEKLVKSLAKLYDGDDDRARQELAALYQAGIIDENGNMVELDIREDGETVSLDDICTKINAGEEIGDLTINGHAATQEQLCKIQVVKNALEVAKMLAEDVEITDEHVENLESLIQGISDGSIDVEDAIKNGSISVSSTKSKASLKSAPLRGTGASSDNDFPETMTSTGEIETDADGKYTGAYISDSTYEGSHEFQLSDPANKTYYTDSRYQGSNSTGSESASTTVMSLTLKNSKGKELTDDTIEITYGIANPCYATVTATIPEAQSVPVTFEYSLGGGFDFPETSKTVTIAAGKTSATFNASLPKYWENLEPWDGKRAFVINISNLKGAVLENNKTTWSKTIQVKAGSSIAREAVSSRYPVVDTLGTVTSDMAAKYNYTKTGQNGTTYYQSFGGGPITQYNAGDYLRYIVHLSVRCSTTIWKPVNAMWRHFSFIHAIICVCVRSPMRN